MGQKYETFDELDFRFKAILANARQTKMFGIWRDFTFQYRLEERLERIANLWIKPSSRPQHQSFVRRFPQLVGNGQPDSIHQQISKWTASAKARKAEKEHLDKSKTP